MLKEKTAKGSKEVGELVGTATKRVEDAKATLQRVMKENSRLEGIQEAQVVKIKKLEASLKVMEQEMREVESSAESRVKATALKAMDNFWASIEFLDEKATTVSKAMKDFRSSTEFHDENIDFTIAAYDEGIKFAQNKVIAYFLNWTWAFWMSS